jgi:hypothetical protein
MPRPSHHQSASARPTLGRSEVRLLADCHNRDSIADMTTEALHKLHTTRPFVPFYLRLGDGQKLPVAHPEMLAYAPKSRLATVWFEDGSFELVDLLLVTGLEVIPGRGKMKRR